MQTHREIRSSLPVGFGKQAEARVFNPPARFKRPGRGKKFSTGAGQLGNKRHNQIENSTLVNRINIQNRLDDSNGSGKVTHNNEMQAAAQTPKTPWFLRIQEALNLRGLARALGFGFLCDEPNKATKMAENAPQTTTTEQKTPPSRIGLGKKAIIAILAVSTVLTPIIEQTQAATSSTNSVRTVTATDGTVATYATSTDQIPDGARPAFFWKLPIIIGGRELFRRILASRWFVGTGTSVIGGTAVYHATKGGWTLPPGAASKGRVQARAYVRLYKVDGQTTHWYGVSGEWHARDGWGFDYNHPSSLLWSSVKHADRIRDYNYFDFYTHWMYWDEENEIWKSNGESQHHYGDGHYLPDCINDAYNQGDPGRHDPDHEDYYKGKEGYLITSGSATMNYLGHEFVSQVYGKKDKKLAASASQTNPKKDKYNPIAIVTVSDMSYEDADGDGTAGWTYTRRAPSMKHTVSRES